MGRQVKIFDTTLRDGEQAPGCSMNLNEKLEVARRLELLRVDVIEAGFAVSSPGDFESVSAIAEKIRNCTVASLARCVEKDIDTAYDALKKAVSPRIHVFIATSPLHMEYKLRMSPEQVIENAAQSVKYARRLCSDIEFSAEDASRSDPEFLVRVIDAAVKNGASVINIPDTVGYATPHEMRELIEFLRNRVPDSDRVEFSVHCHNDLGMATANSLAGVAGGAVQIECSVNGLGERAGNAPLEEVVMAIKTRPELYDAAINIDTANIYKASKLVYNIIGRTAPINKPIVGPNAFAHEAGIHQHGVLANRSTYEIMTPESIGINKGHMVLGKHSGRHAFETRLTELGFELSSADLDICFAKFKELSDKKKDITDKDIEALANNIQPPESEDDYTLVNFSVQSGNFTTAIAVITLRRGDEVTQEVTLGDGPVDASYKAIDKIINPPAHSFDTYIIHSVSEGKDSLGEVLITLRYADRIFNGKGLSTDIIEASILSYINAQNKLMAYKNTHQSQELQESE
ncbi:MAG: 2-isopropylmalate synthase [Eubacteriales bacterium]|jgi:2-isopropylmalate synthase|nr:2-isopropylmalate synthase [Eubacteriales bacterium]